jgi:hypothetical protein
MFSAILQSLPLHHSIPLRLLIQFLSYVASLSDYNFMTQHNLAICFGPTLIRSGKREKERRRRGRKMGGRWEGEREKTRRGEEERNPL